MLRSEAERSLSRRSLGIELPLESGAGGRHLGERRGIDHLVDAAPNLGVFADHRRFIGQPVVVLPDPHGLVHAPSEQRGTDVALVLVPERMHLLVGHGPVERTALVLS